MNESDSVQAKQPFCNSTVGRMFAESDKLYERVGLLEVTTGIWHVNSGHCIKGKLDKSSTIWKYN